jgi:hypothetical protein
MRNSCPLVVVLAGFLCFPAPAGAQRAVVDCRGTLQAYANDASLRQFMSEHQCDCRNGNNQPPVCTKRSQASPSRPASPGRPSYSHNSSKNAWMMQLFQTMLDGFPAGLANSNSSPASSQTPSSYDDAKRQAEEQARAAKIREQLAAAQKEYERQKQEEFEKKKSSLLSDLKGRMTSKNNLAMRQLNCAAYWSQQAMEVMNQGNHDLARVYAENSFQAKDGKLQDCPEAEISLVSTPDDVRAELYDFLVEESSQTVAAVSDAKERKEQTEAKVTAKKAEIEELKKKRDQTGDGNNQAEIDRLLAEADRALQEAVEEDRKATEDLSYANTKLTAVQEMFNSMKTEGNQGQQN